MNKLIKKMILSIIIVSTTVISYAQTTIKMRKQGNVFILPCKVNGLELDMFFDTGADDVSISLTEANYMIKNGYLKDEDIKGKESFRTANGDVSEGTKIIIRKISFAGLELTDVEATIMPNMDAPLLLGQSAIKKLGKIQLDFEENTLTVFKGKGTYDYSRTNKIGKPGFSWSASSDDNSKTSATSNKTSNGETLREVMTLTIDRKGGANGANVAWHPGQKKYYAAQAGNAEFPLEVFDEKGKMVSDNDLATMVDVRGFWYNPNTKTIQMTSYDSQGWSEYTLNSKGIPVSVMKLPADPAQPDKQSVGVYDPKNNAVYFYNMETVSLERHNMNGRMDKTIKLYLGTSSRDNIKGSSDELKYGYNENEIVYTGIAKGEVGLLNVNEKRIELYDINTGLLTQTFKLPSDAPVSQLMNFSYANGIYWLFDKVDRIWHGYKL